MNPTKDLHFSLSEPRHAKVEGSSHGGAESMFYIMPDTCIWIDFLTKAELRTSLAVLERLVRYGDVALLTTDEILDEFYRDEDKKLRLARTERNVLEGYVQSLHGHQDVELVQGAALVLADSKRYLRPDLVAESLTHVRDLQERAIVVPDSDRVRKRVLERIRSGRAPFHNKDKAVPAHMNDAMIIEKFADRAVSGTGDEYFFVSTNKSDYALCDDANRPHEDFVDVFGPDRHFTKHMDLLVQSIERGVAAVDSRRTPEILDRQSWAEIQGQLRTASDRHWQHNHVWMRRKLEDGTAKLVPGRTLVRPYRPVTIGEDSWREELEKARSLLAKNPHLDADDPQEVGFAAGATMALRWVVGEGPAPFQVTAVQDANAGEASTVA